MIQAAQFKIADRKRFRDDTKTQKEFWDYVLTVKPSFRFPLVKPSIPPQKGCSDCGVFPVAYAEIIPTMQNAMLVESWKGIKLPSMDMVSSLRQEYTSLYYQIMNELALHTVPNPSKENLATRTKKSDDIIRKYLKENKVSVGSIAGDGDCFLNAVIQSAIYELNRRNQPSDDLCRMKSTMVRERIVEDLKLALKQK
jgi:hypothetical protein